MSRTVYEAAGKVRRIVSAVISALDAAEIASEAARKERERQAIEDGVRRGAELARADPERETTDAQQEGPAYTAKDIAPVDETRDEPRDGRGREERVIVHDTGNKIKLTRWLNGAAVDHAAIHGPSLARLFRIVVKYAPEYIRWEDLCSRWVNEPGWKGMVPCNNSLKDYGRRIDRIMREAGFTKFWRYSADEVAWKPPRS